MAGQRIGKTYEAIFKVVLDLYRKKNKLKSRIFWNETPIGINGEPDFLIGPDKNHPEIIFMVTHSGSSKDSEKKCWRNIGELCEAKSVLEHEPIAISVVFEGVMKASLKVLQEVAFDGQLIVSDKPYGSDLKRWVHANESCLPTDQNEKAQAILQLYNKKTAMKKVIDDLLKDVGEVCKRRQDTLKRLWTFERSRNRGVAPNSKITCIRRGTSKLLVYEDLDLAIDLYSGKHISVKDIPIYAYSLGLAKKAIGHAVPSDTDIENAVSLLEKNTIKSLCHSLDENGTVQAWILQLRNIENLKSIEKYVKNNYDNLCNKDFLYSAICHLEKDRCALISDFRKKSNCPPVDIWLVTYLIELFKAASNSANGYGIAQLAADVYSTGYGNASDALDAGQFGGGLGFSSWVMRKDSPFREDLKRGIADVFARKIKEIGEEKVSRLIDEEAVKKTLSNNIIEVKLCTYRMYEPLLLLLSTKIKNIRKETFRTCFAEKAGLTGQAGKTSVAISKQTIINWQSATDAGKVNKRKELCGRAVGLRYTWDSQANKFVPRPGVKKLILLLDGTWSQKDLNALVNAGWDEIYYPDEIDKLKAAIV